MPKIVIIGNSAAGFSCAEYLKENSREEEIIVISQEGFPAYRKDLLVSYISGQIPEKEIYLCSQDFYKNKGITFFAGIEAVRIDVKKQAVTLKDKTKIAYDFLVIASGQKIEIPDIPGRTKVGVVPFAELQNARQIKDSLLVANPVCVIGGSAVALRLAEAIAAKNKEVKIIAGAAPADFNPAANIELIAGVSCAELIGETAELAALKLSSGKVIATQLAVFTDNFSTSVGFLKESPINIPDGFIAIDENYRTNLENVFACGSVTKKEISWQEAMSQGRSTAQVILKSFQTGEITCQKC